MTADYRGIPSVDRVLAHPGVARLAQTFSREAVTALTRRQLDQVRKAVANGAPAPPLDEIAQQVAHAAAAEWAAGPRPVINATGVIIHTNLGRAPLSRDALNAVQKSALGYSDLEYDLDAGDRGSRMQHVAALLQQVTGAEAALAVNNNASAVMLMLAALAAGREVIVSRGEAVEIGGGFRIPDVLRQSGATLVEVGTTNRTYLRDYQAALSPRTAALLKVHASNFRITGFTHTATLEELASLARQHGMLLLHDLGSGCLLPTERFGLAHEPTPQESITASAELVCFSTDKLLGGPQGGVVAGKRELVERVARHPLARAVRMDKLGLAALSATLLHYVKGEAIQEVPVWRMIAAPLDELETRARRWAHAVHEAASVVRGESTIGGGSLPGETLPTWLLALTPGSAGSPEELLRRLRHAPTPVIGRVVDDQVVLDPRTVSPDEEETLLEAVRHALPM
ncbi:MAG: L-seryl-tRNA(Sec) selenium transferase [Dehalococcoidia bacterium]|nr:L-seryl-tRNA(Sec) selenium transferase [Dehalococcoidia bacterium]